MSITNCALTGAPLEHPVVSKKSGYVPPLQPRRHVFERRVIEKHIEESGKCPITGLALSKDDLVEINGNGSL